MHTVTLGRTGLEVGVAGLGCGGTSRLGQGTGATEAESVAVVRRALELGVTYLDTARAYGTESIVARGIAGHRDEVVISTKASVRTDIIDGDRVTRARLRESLERSLRALDTETIDVYHLHGIGPDDYEYCLDELVPELQALRDAGHLRHIAISERWVHDLGHEMLARALRDDCWDVMMVGFNFVNHSARGVLQEASRQGIGVEIMYAARGLLSRPDLLEEEIRTLVADGRADIPAEDLGDPLGYLLAGSGASSLVDAAYRYCRHEPGAHVVLTGTGSIEHLEQNVRSINAAPLPDPTRERLDQVFARVTHVTGGDIPGLERQLDAQLRALRTESDAVESG